MGEIEVENLAKICFVSPLTEGESKFKIYLCEGGEVHEMDVPPCNPLFDLWFVAMVLSKTLNCS